MVEEGYSQVRIQENVGEKTKKDSGERKDEEKKWDSKEIMKINKAKIIYQEKD